MPFVVRCVALALISTGAFGQTYQIATVAGRTAVLDGAPANEVLVRGIAGVAIDSQGSLLVSSTEEHKIFRISEAKVISTAAGTGRAGYSGENQSAFSTELSSATGVAAGHEGSIWFIDSGNVRVRKIAADGIIKTVAGNGEQAYSDADS